MIMFELTTNSRYALPCSREYSTCHQHFYSPRSLLTGNVREQRYGFARMCFETWHTFLNSSKPGDKFAWQKQRSLAEPNARRSDPFTSDDRIFFSKNEPVDVKNTLNPTDAEVPSTAADQTSYICHNLRASPVAVPKCTYSQYVIPRRWSQFHGKRRKFSTLQPQKAHEQLGFIEFF
jgi:hypothetical protein